jgi:hypothetical protein
MSARWSRPVTTVVPLLALLATTLLAMMVALDAGLSLCPGNDVHAEMGGREITICPVVLGLVVVSALLAAGAIVVLWRDRQRALAWRGFVHALSHLPIGRTAGVLMLAGGIALASMIVCDGDGLPPLPAGALLAALLAACSFGAALLSIAAAHIAIALAQRVILAVATGIARGRDTGPVRITRFIVPVLRLEGAALLAAGRGLRAPPVSVR